MSKGGAGGAAAVFIGGGVAFAFVWVMAIVMVTAAVTAMIGILVGVVIAIMALIGWGMCMGKAMRQNDIGWAFDLILIPLCGLAAAAFFAKPLERWETTSLEDTVNRVFNTQHISPIAAIILALCVLLMLVLTIAVPIGLALMLAIDDRVIRLWAYPGFVIYGTALVAFAIAVKNGA